ncbi:hypothetical protein IQ235_03340 [Oscillatoriales cyanobacterium LEGE 11467]|uniref:Uncharacterized protein n=1 Tax=Zarconia navalis LEGE 11467 TaxID=1828826 RepID=A0A928VX15_9CYAN|nr:hypothetical protein [Zarconia navalis]MBE9039826.1 hypothetical protein [Zarconia navalis LEGE 11467]
MTAILTVVTEEVEHILNIYYEADERETLRANQLRARLIDYVMNRIQVDLSMRVYLSPRSAKLRFPYRSLELRLKVENYARAGFRHLVRTPVDITHHSDRRTQLA